MARQSGLEHSTGESFDGVIIFRDVDEAHVQADIFLSGQLLQG